jgi:hypothetical protein
MRDMPKRGSRTATNKANKQAKFKPCAGCPTPAKCAKMGVCMKKLKK